MSAVNILKSYDEIQVSLSFLIFSPAILTPCDSMTIVTDHIANIAN